MLLRRAFVLFWLFLWVAEPFLVLAGTLPAAKHAICATCGMKDNCGNICCCAHLKKGLADCGQLPAGLYPAGCNSQDSTARFFSEGTSKWFLPSETGLAPIPSQRTFHSIAVTLPSLALEPASPPPEPVFLP